MNTQRPPFPPTPTTDSPYGGRQVIDQTKDYVLVAGSFKSIESVAGRKVYGIINKSYLVVEAVGPGLPAALSTLYSLQADLDGVLESVKQAKKGGSPMDEFLGFDTPDGDGYDH